MVDDFEALRDLGATLLPVLLKELLDSLAIPDSSYSCLQLHKTVQALHQILLDFKLVGEVEVCIQLILLCANSGLILQLVL